MATSFCCVGDGLAFKIGFCSFPRGNNLNPRGEQEFELTPACSNVDELAR